MSRSQLLIAGIGLFVAGAALAGLGQPVVSVQADHAALRGVALAVTPMSFYDVHTITLGSGTRVREYASRAGTVFAVTWSGRAKPDLSVVLAQHYGEYLQAAAHHASHKVLSIATPGLVMHLMKLPRGFSGAAYVPALLPPGTSAQDIR